jgi:ubiquinone/menaquinone biosynthesis C-methylase UbiE
VTYPLDASTEQERLIAQSSVIDRKMARVLAEAGLQPGMRVLDLGAGVGDVSLLAARLVSPTGEVVGVEVDPGRVAAARQRVTDAGIANVRIECGDVRWLEAIEGDFDAVIGRLILMYLPNPVATVRCAAERVRPGGIVLFQEGQFEWAPSSRPIAPLFEQAVDWWVQTTIRVGTEPHMGMKLFETFRAAGLPAPDLRFESVISSGEDPAFFDWVAGVVRGILPLMERFGVATRDEVDVDTFAERLRADVAAANGVLVGPPFVSAWSRL